jgi:hypothetical protein
MAGELLPLPHRGEVFTVLNITECINCLDHNRTRWVLGKSTGARIRIKEYAFHPNRFSESVLFKIPETCKADVLVVEGLPGCEVEEFRYVVEQNGLEGLLFEEIWSSE